jgi:hypothetical protein
MRFKPPPKEWSRGRRVSRVANGRCFATSDLERQTSNVRPRTSDLEPIFVMAKGRPKDSYGATPAIAWLIAFMSAPRSLPSDPALANGLEG